MDIERIRQIQKETAYPDSISVQQALLKVWDECVNGNNFKKKLRHCENENCAICGKNKMPYKEMICCKCMEDFCIKQANS